MLHNKFKSKGLTTAEVNRARENTVRTKLPIKNNMFLHGLLDCQDPMTILLLVASTIYFISGKTSDGIF
jgi:Ca2+-transporting ATPase